MSRELWAKWYSKEAFLLIRYLRSLRFGKCTVEVHEKQPVKIWQPEKEINLSREAAQDAGNIDELPGLSTE